MSSDRVPRYSLEDDLEEAAERVSRELPQQIARVRAHVREARRRLLVEEDDNSSSTTGTDG
ncbi:hypothetical protein ACFODL_02765 [Phenylobacterium terrae]|uniref:DUF1192 domain-containing protein n=1 Tax=Phenylobacterium terrae TaxID=2665495 RepID=A0ABW4N472_9CAUL